MFTDLVTSSPRAISQSSTVESAMIRVFEILSSITHFPTINLMLVGLKFFQVVGFVIVRIFRVSNENFVNGADGDKKRWYSNGQLRKYNIHSMLINFLQ